MHQKKHLILPIFPLRLPFVVFSILLLVGLIATPAVIARANQSTTAWQYVALGDSLPFGYQPNNDFTHGYATDLFQKLQKYNGYATLVNLSCAGETSDNFINGDPNHENSQRNCLLPEVQNGSQLASAVADLQQNASQTGLVTLQIGIDDFLSAGAIDLNTCAIDQNQFNTQLGVVDQDLRQTILPQLQQALSSAPYHRASLVLVGYFDPLVQLCPATVPYIQTFNSHLKADAQGYARFVDISALFTATNVCQLTWICQPGIPPLGAIHPNTQGYQLIADTIYAKVLY